ncbi:hypothetical protein SLA2020_431470 [Shorea laevis]
MDFVSWFFVESKAFELSVPAGGSILRLVERRNGISRVMMVGKFCVEWLKKTVERMVLMDEDQPFTESSREGNRAFFAQRGANRAGCFLELAEYAVGGRRGLIIVPEGRDKRGWKRFAGELGKAMTAFASSSGKPEGGGSQPPLLPLSGKKSAEPSSYGGRRPSFAEVVSAVGKPSFTESGGSQVVKTVEKSSAGQGEEMGKTQFSTEAMGFSGVEIGGDSGGDMRELDLFPSGTLEETPTARTAVNCYDLELGFRVPMREILREDIRETRRGLRGSTAKGTEVVEWIGKCVDLFKFEILRQVSEIGSSTLEASCADGEGCGYWGARRWRSLRRQ